MIQSIRVWLLVAVLVTAVALIGLGFLHPVFWWLELLFVPLVILGIYDYMQPRHSILRNFPILGHMRFIIEDMGPELHQYLVESDTDGRPFDRDTRSLIYERAKGVDGQEAVRHRARRVRERLHVDGPLDRAPTRWPPIPVADLRVTVGGAAVHPAVLAVGAQHLGHELRCPRRRQAVRAMNTRRQDGQLRPLHRRGRPLQVPPRERRRPRLADRHRLLRLPQRRTATSLPSCSPRTPPTPQVKMIEIKVSQGAKPGHGGILPGAKVTEEIAEARLVPPGKDVFSPTYHKAFSTPLEMTAFIAQLRELSGGKPVGFKLCIGDPREFMAIVKAMIETDTYPDFIVVDGGEGGTGAAPLEFSDSLGVPARRGPDDRAEHPRRRRHPRPDEARRQRQDGHRLGDGPVDGARRRLLQLGPRRSCSRSAASSRSAATPTSARSASPPRTPSSSGRSSCPTRPSGCTSSTATRSTPWPR